MSVLVSRLAEVTTSSSGSSAAGFMFAIIFALVFTVLMVAAMWKVFTKAGKPGWASIVPIYNTIVELEIIGRPIWWVLLLLIPFVNIIVSLIILFDLAKAFGKGAMFGLVLLFLPFIGFPMLAWGKATYTAPGGGAPTTPDAPSAPTDPQSPVQAPPAMPPPDSSVPPATPPSPIQ